MERNADVMPQESGAGLRQLSRFMVQFLKFGLVGLLATSTHVTAFLLWIAVAGMTPLGANVAAFCVAVLVGFVGHFFWTFRPEGGQEAKPWQAVLGKFVVASLSGFALNSLAVYLVVNVLAMPYVYAAVLMITVVPAGTFALAKFWVFS